MVTEHRLTRLLAVGARLIVIATQEEERALSMLDDAMRKARMETETEWKLAHWDAASGWSDEKSASGQRILPNPREAIARIEADQEACRVFVLKDVSHLLKSDPAFVRAIRNFVAGPDRLWKRVVLIQTTPFLPQELANYAVVEELPLPGKAEFRTLLARYVRPFISEPVREALMEAMKGMTYKRALLSVRIAASAAHGYNLETAQTIMAEKKQLMAQSEALSFMDGEFSMDSVGGLNRFKRWLSDQRVAFTEYGRENGLAPPKGVLLAGIPGTGKSLAAKAAASVLALPLVKLDISRIFRSFVGESEAACANTLKILSSLAPCVCLVDELDKSFGASASTDSGTTQRVLGQLLHYMQEGGEGVFFVATCNHVEKLPPELVRKGRFADEIFFVDLPTMEEREEILRIHVEQKLKKIGCEPLVLAVYAGMMADYTGAEIESVVKKALIAALNERRPAQPQDITRAIDQQIPLSRSMAEPIADMRQLVQEGRYLSAS